MFNLMVSLVKIYSSFTADGHAEDVVKMTTKKKKRTDEACLTTAKHNTAMSYQMI